jgi:hypothetical protein
LYGSGDGGSGSGAGAGSAGWGSGTGWLAAASFSPSRIMGLSYAMSKKPRKPKDEDFNEAAFRVVREATAAHEPEPQPQNPALKHDDPSPTPPAQPPRHPKQ